MDDGPVNDQKSEANPVLRRFKLFEIQVAIYAFCKIPCEPN